MELLPNPTTPAVASTIPVSHTTRANSTAVAVGYAPDGPGLGVDGAPQGGGHRDEARRDAGDPAVMLARPPRIEVRRPWFDIRYVLRDWNGMGSIDDWARALVQRRGVTRADNNRNNGERGLAFDTSPVIERGTLSQWDEGTAVKARAGKWW